MPGGFKLLMLLSTPFPLRPSSAIRFARHSRLPLELLPSASASRSRFLSVTPSSKLGFSIKASEQTHSQEVAKEGHRDTATSNPRFSGSYSCPEWSKLTDDLLSKGYLQRPAVLSDEDDFFSTDGGVSEEFSMAAEACIRFARERPDLLRLLSKKCIETVVENGSPYLFRNGEKSVISMRLFLAGNESNALELEKAKTIDIMRYLLSYMHQSFSTSNGNQFKVGESVETSVRKLLLELFDLSGTVWRSKLPEPTTKEPLFVNEHLARPHEKSFEMKRGDWICQKCTFMNFARNMSCLECGDARPKSQLTGSEWTCPQCDFFNYGRNISCLRCDCKRPSDSPPFLRPSGDLEHSRSRDSGENTSERLGPDNTPDSISRSLDRILGRSSSSGNLSTTRDHNSPSSGNSSSSQIRQNPGKLRRNPDVAPFVPLPPDMFRKTPESNNDVQKSSVKGNASFSDTRDFIDTLFKSSENSTNMNKESSAASSDSSNSVPDDDFPDIMPIRKGENRFVVSKKKDRSLTSPAYKRRLAMEQTNSYNSIPFVPFPPDYFAKKDIQPAADSTENTPPSSKAETLPENQGEQKSGLFDQGSAQTSTYRNPARNSSESTNSSWNYNQDVASHSQTSNTSPANYRSSSTQPSYGGFAGNSSPPSGRSWGDDSGNRSRGASVVNNASVSSPENTRRSDDYSFKSLEGSCVKEPDPLDMSEEAKAERWFRRAAQINDISELSQIPDEDFPEIMPMRKGVNRFVVSKRKTPLERRLTSPQYRKNLPVVSSEPEKDTIN